MLDHRTLPEHRQLLQARQRWILETERRNFQPKNLRGGRKREGEKEEKRGRESAGKLCEWVRVDLGLRRTYETAVDDTCSLCTRHKAQGTRQAHAKLLSLSYLHM